MRIKVWFEAAGAVIGSAGEDDEEDDEGSGELRMGVAVSEERKECDERCW